MTAARLASMAYTSLHLVFLPVPTTRDKKHVANTDILLEDTLLSAERGSFVVGYGLPDSYVSMAERKECSVLDLSRDEEYLIENAYLTALGATGYILTTDGRSPSELSFGVVGYGRIGTALVRILLFLGARVRVFTSRHLTRIDLGEFGVESRAADISVGSYDFSGIDVLINTAPKDMSDKFPDRSPPPTLRVLELASGDNFSGVFGVEKLPALPEKMYPESAGRAYFSAVERFINSQSGIY